MSHESYLSAKQAGKAVALALVRTGRYGDQLWVLARMRKGHDCVVTGQHIDRGVSAYRPVTNGYNRMDRISVFGMAQLMERNKDEATHAGTD